MKRSNLIILILSLFLLTLLCGCSKKIRAPKAIESGAKEFIDEYVDEMNDPEFARHGLRIIDSKITKLERIAVFNDILDYPIELWNLEFKLKPNDNTEHAIKTGTVIEEGWITEDNGMGKSCLIFKIDGSNTILLDSRQAEEFDLKSLSKQEIRVRDILTNMDLLPNGAYEGNHIIIGFPIFEDRHVELFLSQPVIQGEKGIWAVEKWKEEGWSINNVYPGIDARRTDIGINEKYQELQDQFSSGEDLSLGNPIEVAMSFIKYKLRQVYFEQLELEVEDLEVTYKAKMEDFAN